MVGSSPTGSTTQPENPRLVKNATFVEQFSCEIDPQMKPTKQTACAEQSTICPPSRRCVMERVENYDYCCGGKTTADALVCSFIPIHSPLSCRQQRRMRGAGH